MKDAVDENENSDDVGDDEKEDANKNLMTKGKPESGLKIYKGVLKKWEYLINMKKGEKYCAS